MKPLLLQILILLTAPLLLAGLNVWLNPNRPAWQVEALAEGEVNIALLETWARPVLWVDARGPESYAKDHIPEAIHLTLSSFDQQMGTFLDRWEPGLTVVIYCDSRQCGASKELAERLRNELGMDDIHVLKGGWEAWLEAK